MPKCLHFLTLPTSPTCTCLPHHVCLSVQYSFLTSHLPPLPHIPHLSSSPSFPFLPVLLVNTFLITFVSLSHHLSYLSPPITSLPSPTNPASHHFPSYLTCLPLLPVNTWLITFVCPSHHLSLPLQIRHFTVSHHSPSYLTYLYTYLPHHFRLPVSSPFLIFHTFLATLPSPVQLPITLPPTSPPGSLPTLPYLARPPSSASLTHGGRGIPRR